MFRTCDIDDYGNKRLRRVIFTAMWLVSIASTGALIYGILALK